MAGTRVCMPNKRGVRDYSFFSSVVVVVVLVLG